MGTIRYLIWVFLLILVTVYMSSCVFRIGLMTDHSEVLQKKMGDIISTMFWHMAFITGEGYDEFLDEFAEFGWWDRIAWTSVVLVAVVFFSQVMLNISIGLLSMKSIDDEKTASQELDSFMAESDMFKEVLQSIFSSMDRDQSGRLDRAELNKLLDSPDVQDAMRVFAIRPDFNRNHMLAVFGLTGDNSSISFEEFQNHCLALSGCMNDIRPFWLHVDVMSQMKAYMSSEVSGFVSQTQALETAAVNCQMASMSCATDPVFTGPGDEAQSSAVAEGDVELLTAAQARMGQLERQQQEMVEAVVGLRQDLSQQSKLSEGLGQTQLLSDSLAVCCNQGHSLAPVGTLLKPLLFASYSHWTCDGKHSMEGCKYSPSGASHLSGLQRFHCSRCFYDLCEHCYMFRLASSLKPS